MKLIFSILTNDPVDALVRLAVRRVSNSFYFLLPCYKESLRIVRNMNAIIPGVPPQKNYLARFHAGPIEMAYQHNKSDQLSQELNVPDWCAGSPSSPYKNGSSSSGPLYGVNVVPVHRSLFCLPFVDSCKNQNTRAPAPSLTNRTPVQEPNILCGM